MIKKKLFFIVLFIFCASCEKTEDLAAPEIELSALYEEAGNGLAGNVRGDVTVVEFFDYRCPACHLSFPALYTLPLIDPGVRIIYRELPLLGYVSEIAAKASLASRYQNKYIAFHDALMSATFLSTEEDVFDIARQVGLDVEKLKRDMTQPSVVKRIQENRAWARALHMNGTPVFFFGKTAWKKEVLFTSAVERYEGAMTLNALKKTIVRLRY